MVRHKDNGEEYGRLDLRKYSMPKWFTSKQPLGVIPRKWRELGWTVASGDNKLMWKTAAGPSGKKYVLCGIFLYDPVEVVVETAMRLS